MGTTDVTYFMYSKIFRCLRTGEGRKITCDHGYGSLDVGQGLTSVVFDQTFHKRADDSYDKRRRFYWCSVNFWHVSFLLTDVSDS
uniref:Uncharacterized protein n=1 Tax=Romanomermis culicivorax TaxID=13658 RepID=A0A915HN90_ROMCU